MPERGGGTLARVFAAEADALPTIRQLIANGTTVHADESPAWNRLYASFAMQRINRQDGYSIDGACTKGATAIRSTASMVWRCDVAHRWILRLLATRVLAA